MITDLNNTFEEATNAYGASAQVGDILDLGAEYDAGVGEPLIASVVVTTAYAGAGSTQTFALQTCDTEGGTYVTIATTAALALTDLADAAVHELMARGYKRFVRIYRTLGGTATAGAVSAYLGMR